MVRMNDIRRPTNAKYTQFCLFTRTHHQKFAREAALVSSGSRNFELSQSCPLNSGQSRFL